MKHTKAIAIGTGVLVLAGLGTGAAVASGNDVGPFGNGDLDRAEQVALDHVGEGTVTAADSEDDGPSAYEVEVTRDDGTEVDVLLDDRFQVLGTEDDRTDGDDGAEDGRTQADGDGTVDADDRPLSADEQRRAEQAALAEVGDGTVTGAAEAGDGTVDGTDVAYEVEVTRTDGTEVDVWLDRDYGVVSTATDAAGDDD